MAGALVLVVEDNALNLELVTDVLSGAGFEVAQSRTAEEALVEMRREAPALVLMDIRLPGMDGYSAVRAIREDPLLQRIPVIALTAQAMRGDEQAALEAGFDSHITKPIDTRGLPAEVARWIAVGRSRA